MEAQLLILQSKRPVVQLWPADNEAVLIMLVRAMGGRQKLSERVRYKQSLAGLNNGPLRSKGRLERKQAPGSGV